MKQFKISNNINIALGDFDGSFLKKKTKQGNDLYVEAWIGKAKYNYTDGTSCTMYIFSFFRILYFKK